MAYAVFPDMATFTTWQAQVCTTLGLPNSEGTENYTDPITKAGTAQVIAGVSELVDTSTLTTMTNQEAENWMKT